MRITITFLNVNCIHEYTDLFNLVPNISTTPSKADNTKHIHVAQCTLRYIILVCLNHVIMTSFPRLAAFLVSRLTISYQFFLFIDNPIAGIGSAYLSINNMNSTILKLSIGCVYHHTSGVELRFANDFQGDFCR